MQNHTIRIEKAKLKDLCKNLFSEGYSYNLDKSDLIPRLKSFAGKTESDFFHAFVTEEEKKKIEEILERI